MKRILLTLFLLSCLCACTPQTADPVTEVPATDLPASPTQPAAAPLLRVAYSKDADPWLWTEGEGARQLADSVNVVDVRLSCDGLVVAFKRDDTGELLAVNADGSGLHTLVSADFLAGQNALIWKFYFAPGSHTVFFTLMDAGYSFVPYYDLYRVDASARTPAVELVLEAGEGGIPTFSPDGQWLTIYHPGALNLVRTDGSETRPIFSYPEGYEPATFGPEIVWRDDSSGFSFFHDNKAEFIPIQGDILVSATVSSLWGAVSEEGLRVAYTTPDGEVHIVEADGTDTLYTTLENGSFGSWLPDSEHFTVILDVPSESGYGMGNQYLLGALGEELVPLHDTSEAYPVVWISSDRFLFTSLGELRLQTIGEASQLLDENVYNIVEYAWIVP